MHNVEPVLPAQSECPPQLAKLKTRERGGAYLIEATRPGIARD